MSGTINKILALKDRDKDYKDFKILSEEKKNLIVNGDFSTGDNTGWGRESGLVGFNISTDKSYVGNYSVRWKKNSANKKNYSNHISAQEGEIYSLSFMANLTGDDFNKNACYVEVAFLNSNEGNADDNKIKSKRFDLKKLLNGEEGEWHKAEISGAKAPPETKYVAVHMRWWRVEDPIYLDAFCLTKGYKASPYTPAPEDINADPYISDLAEMVYQSKADEKEIGELENAVTELGGD